MRFIYKPSSESTLEKIWPWIGSAALLLFMIYFTLNIGYTGLIDYVDLLIHEGGHGIFRFFGKFIYTLGGTLMQIIIPSMFVVFYFIKKNRFGAQVFLLWLGQNFFNISVYVADARAQQLPLLGGGKVYHDWHFILGEVELLDYDKLFSNLFVYLAFASFAVALIMPLLIKSYKQKKIKLDL